MTSVRSSFLCLPLTSDEIKNVVRLSPRRNGKSTTYNSPRSFCHACGNTSDRNRRRDAARNALIPRLLANTMTNIFLTVALHRTILGFQVTLQKEENDPAGAVKNSREGRSVFYLTELDSGAMINSLLPENYRTSHAEKSNFDYSGILLNKRISDRYIVNYYTND